MEVGDRVEWTNGSYVIDTHASGTVVAVHDSHIVVKRQEIAEIYPHLNPFIIKRVWELRVIEEQMAA